MRYIGIIAVTGDRDNIEYEAYGISQMFDSACEIESDILSSQYGHSDTAAYEIKGNFKPVNLQCVSAMCPTSTIEFVYMTEDGEVTKEVWKNGVVVTERDSAVRYDLCRRVMFKAAV